MLRKLRQPCPWQGHSSAVRQQRPGSIRWRRPVRGQVRSFIEELLEEELEGSLGRGRYERGAVSRHWSAPRGTGRASWSPPSAC